MTPIADRQIIFRTVTGSRAYGTAVETSDTDYKGVYIAHPMDHALRIVQPQVEINKDHVVFELTRFVELARKGNPTILEMLYSPPELWVSGQDSELWSDVLYYHRHLFLSKLCRHSFGGYAVQQIKKAKGLDKKMNWEKSRVERKGVLDFCYVGDAGKSLPVKRWLADREMSQEFCGLVSLDKMPGAYALYYDHVAQHAHTTKARLPILGYQGIVSEDGNDVRLSSVPKDAPPPETVLLFNKPAYSQHCKDYREYKQWLDARNVSRYVDTKTHGQQIDGKNLMHCRRLIDMGLEIAETGTFTVQRPDHKELLKIRRGEVDLTEVIAKAEEDLTRMDKLFDQSNLPEEVDLDFTHRILRRCHHVAQANRLFEST